MKVFLDANILFSAALPGSKLRVMIQTLLRHSACVTNRHAREEAERNLQIKRPDCLGELRDLLTRIPIHEGLAELAAVEIRDKDKPIFASRVRITGLRLLSPCFCTQQPGCGHGWIKLLDFSFSSIGWRRRLGRGGPS